MNTCIINTGFYNPDLHKAELTYVIGKAFRQARKTAEARSEKLTEQLFYDQLLDSLRKNTEFKVDYSSEYTDAQRKRYKRSISDLVSDLLDGGLIPDKYKTQFSVSAFRQLLKDNFVNDIGAKRLRFNTSDQPDMFDIETADETEDITNDLSFGQYVKKVYGTHVGGKSYLRNSFMRDIMRCALIDTTTQTRVNDEEQMNVAISDYKESLFKKIATFLNLPGAMYDGNGKVTSDYGRVMSQMMEHVNSNVSQDRINDMYLSVISGNQDSEFDAVNAYTILRYFDSLLEDNMKNIKFDGLYKNQELEVMTYKYRFSADTSHQRKNWSDSDSRTSIQNTANFSKTILESIPLITRGNVGNNNVGILRFNIVVDKIFRNASRIFKDVDRKTPQVCRDFKSNVLRFHDSPTLNAINIFKAIHDSKSVRNELKNVCGFSSNDFDVAESMYKYVFSAQDDDSFNKIERNTIKRQGQLRTYSVVDDIAGVMDNVMGMSYLQTQVDSYGNTTVSIRRKSFTGRNATQFINNLNFQVINIPHDDRKALRENCRVTYPNPLEKSNANVEIRLSPQVSFDVNINVTNRNEHGLLGQFLNYDMTSGSDVFRRLRTLFGDRSPIDLSNNAEREKILRSRDLSDDESLFAGFLRFIDDRLNTKFMTEDGLQKLYFLDQLMGDQDYMGELLLYAVKSQVVSDLYHDFEEQQDTTDIFEFMKKAYPSFKGLDPRNNPREFNKFFTKINGVNFLRAIPDGVSWVDTYVEATNVLQGENLRSVSKNQERNNEANYATSFLGGNIQNVLETARQAKRENEERRERGDDIPETVSGKLFFTENSSAIVQVVNNSDVQNRNLSVKSVRRMRNAETFQNAIVNNFWGNFINTGQFSIQPTTYSDKTKFVQYMIDGGYMVDVGEAGRVPLSELTTEQVTRLYSQTIGQAAKAQLDNVTHDYLRLWGDQSLTLQQINTRLKGYTEERLVKEAQEKGVQLQLDLHYRKSRNGTLSVNELLPYQAMFSNEEFLSGKLGREKVHFINDLVDSGAQFYVFLHDHFFGKEDRNNIATSLRNELTQSNSPLAKIILNQFRSDTALSDYMKKWVRNGKLVLAYENGNPVTYQNVSDSHGLEVNPLLDKYFYLDSFLGNNLRFHLTGFETNHPNKENMLSLYRMETKRHPGIMSNKLLYASDGNPSANIEKLQKAKILWTNLAVEERPDIIVYDRIPENVESVMGQGKLVVINNNNLDDVSTVAGMDGGMSIGYSIDTGSAVLAGDLGFTQVMGLRNGLDVTAMMDGNNVLHDVAMGMGETIQNLCQGTQLKRNVIIPATLNYVHVNMLNGPAAKAKVAVIRDVSAKVFNFDGQSDAIKSMDGSTFTIAPQSILENKALNSQEVGADKKTIWHYYDDKTGTASLVKHAAFEINNQRMLMSQGSDISLLDIYRKMTDMRWQRPDGGWNTLRPIRLDQTVDMIGRGAAQETIPDDQILQKVTGKGILYYRKYDDDGNAVYMQITGFGYDGAYYTIESSCDDRGDPDYDVVNEKTYHYFDSSGNHFNEARPGSHTINSVYELWQAMGGMYSQSVGKDGILRNGEDSQHAVVGFMNSVMFLKEGGDRQDLTQVSYEQPLKEMMIGYLSNNTAFKNGAANVNSSARWFDGEDLTYMTMDIKGLGVQQDSDHDVEEDSVSTEPSQVISALESGGLLHDEVRQIYHDLGKIALQSSSVELDTLAKYLDGENPDEARSYVYDLVGRTLLNNASSGNQASLTDSILQQIGRHFNKNMNHLADDIKLPFSDSNIHSQILPTIVSQINKKSIKRKYPGAGCVMIPGYDIVQYYQVGDRKLMFEDMVDEARAYISENGITIPAGVNDKAKWMVDTYLDVLQQQEEIQGKTDGFIPTDIVDIMLDDGTFRTVSLDGLDEYYAFKDNDFSMFGIDKDRVTGFRRNVKRKKNLAPSRITFELEDGTRMNVFDLDVFRNAHRERSIANTRDVQKAFRQLKDGYVTINGQRHAIRNLQNQPAELVMSNIYGHVFEAYDGNGERLNSVDSIMKAGPDAFRKRYQPDVTGTDNYDVRFDGDKPLYITFRSPYGKTGNNYVPYRQSSLYYERNERNGVTDVYLMSDDNEKLFKVGRLMQRPDLTYTEGEYRDGNNEVITNTRNLRHDNGTVYEYVQFLSRYNVTEEITLHDGTKSIRRYDKYYLDFRNLDKVFHRDGGEDSHDDERYKAFVTGLFNDLFSSSQFENVIINENLSRRSAGMIVKYMSNMKIDNDLRFQVMLPIERLLRTELQAFGRKPGRNTNEDVIDLTGKLTQIYDDYYDQLADAKFSSWQQSLYFTSARIPAQNLQSFMQMRVVAYTGNTMNQAHVSHWQTWLQGSKPK